MHTRNQHRLTDKPWQKFTLCLLAAAYISTSGADQLDLADNALEVISAVEPNIVILTDDSGSMDLGVMALGPESGNDGELKFNSRLYSYTHPAPNSSGDAPATNIFTSEYAITEEYFISQSFPAPYHGTWRVWNKDFNKVYYNPDVTYTPWAGLNKNGVAFVDANPTGALYNPYDPDGGNLDLTVTLASYSARYGFGSGSSITVPGFYPARYYTWTDTNDDGYVDADDTHQLIEIRNSGCGSIASCPTNFIRKKFNQASGIGRSDCATDNDDGTVTCNYNEEIQNFANWFSYYRKRGLAANANFSFVIKDNTTAKIGYATLHNNNSVAITPASMNVSTNSGNKKALLDKLYQTRPNSGTPLRTNLKYVGEYYDCTSNNSHIFSSVTSNSECPIAPAPAGACQQNYTVLMTDGFYNGSNPSGIDNNDGDNDSDYDGGATADDNSDTLADVAMYFYEKDLSDLIDDVSLTNRDIRHYPGDNSDLYDADGDPISIHQHMATYTIGFGVEGSLSSMPSDPTMDTTDPVFWPDPQSDKVHKIDDLRHAAYNGRGDFLQADNPVALKQGLESVFEEIGQSGGAASAVAFNTQNIASNSLVFRAFFDTKLNTGDMIAQKVTSEGLIEPDIEWSAATQLDDRTASSRVIVTYKSAGLNSTGIPFRWSDLTTNQQDLLDLPQPANIADEVGSDRLNWLRGAKDQEGPSFDDGDFRERGEKGLLGDLVHSTPVFVGSPQFKNRNNAPFPHATVDVQYSTFQQNQASRQELVYVGANDGMLHAFDANTGEEVFAYIPNLVFDNLSSLTDPDYTHRYYVDLTPSINDAFIGSSWKTILVGGLGKGGKGYYALDINDPSAFANETSAAAKVMWEFTEDDDGSVGNSDLGYSYSEPIIVMTNAASGGQQRWAAVFGNGYNSTSSDGDAAIYVLFLDGGTDGVWTSGSDFIKINTPNGKSESADGNTPNGFGGIRAIDADLNGTMDYVYAGDLQGNLHRFDFTSSNTNQWDDDGVLFKASYGSSPSTDQPITSLPIVVKHPNKTGFIVIFGTGSWMTYSDQQNEDIQSIYGIWDDLSGLPSNSTPEVSKNELVEQVFTSHQSPIGDYYVRTLTNHEVSWKNNGGNQVRGWHIDLDVPPASGSGVEFPGERAVRNLQLRGPFIFVNTIIPKPTDQCSAGVGGYELGFDPINGGVSSDTGNFDIIFDTNISGDFGEDDNVGGGGSGNDGENIVTGIQFGNSTPAGSSFIGEYRVTQTSDKSVRTTKTNTKVSSGRESWQEIIP